LSEHPKDTTPTASSPLTLLTSDDDWVNKGLAMRRHPAGKAIPQDNQAAAEELLAKITAPPLTSFEEAAMETYAELMDLLVTKQADYGPHAITRSPGGALNGINVRMHDKLARVVNLTGRPTDAGAGQLDPAAVNHESVRDTYRDLANYAVIAVMVLDGVWPRD
jgi:hypothetical protein